MKFLIILSSLIISLAHGELGVGAVFPSPAANGVAGNMPATKGKVVLYDFWASWCMPCRQALPAYEQLYQKYHAKGLEIIAVGIEGNGDAQKFVGKLKLSYPVVVDAKQKFVALVAPESMPTSFLVGKNGKVLSVHSGFKSSTVKELDAAIAAALN